MFVWGTGVSHVVFVALLSILACGMKHANTTHKLENWSKLRGKLMIKIEKFWRAGLKSSISVYEHTQNIFKVCRTPLLKIVLAASKLLHYFAFLRKLPALQRRTVALFTLTKLPCVIQAGICEGICTCIQKVTGTSHFPFFIREYNQCHAIASCSRRAKWRRSEALLHQHLINTSMFSPAQLL